MTNLHVLVMAALVALSFGASGALGASPSAVPPVAPPIAPPVSPPVVAGADKSTLRELRDGNQLEIQMGKLAEEKGSTSSVRGYGRQLVADHTAADRKLDAILRRRVLDLSVVAAPTGVADPDHELLATKSGLEFDRAFAAQMVRDHQKMIDLLENARIETADDTLRLFYDAVLTTVRAHKRVAEELLAASAQS